MQLKKSVALFKRVMLWCCLLLIKAYRCMVRPYLPNQCRFTPSCSQYAEECLKQHELAYGLYLTVRRILRCHPFACGGIDLVPKIRKK